MSLWQDTSIGFRLGGRTSFEGVQMLRPASAQSDVDRSAQGLEQLALIVAHAFRCGAALELTGGVDSRLVLALGASVGASPSRAFTIGREDDADVMIAKQLARRLGIEHRTVEVPPMREGDVDESIRLVAQSGFVCNAATYAWLPGALASLEGWRDSQIGGTGGEIATGFYYTPFDCAMRWNQLAEWWIRYRLERRQEGRVHWCVREIGQELGRRARDEALAVIGETGGSWRTKVDALYARDRMGNWAMPLLQASANYYRVHAPLCDSAYVEWASGLSQQERANRRGQLATVVRLMPKIKDIPYSGRTRTTSARFARVIAVSQRLMRRKPSDKGSDVGALWLGRDEVVRGALQVLSRECSWLDIDGVEDWTVRPRGGWQEFGAIATAALALRERNLWRQVVRGDREGRIEGSPH